jgi:hypothetical protein
MTSMVVATVSPVLGVLIMFAAFATRRVVVFVMFVLPMLEPSVVVLAVSTVLAVPRVLTVPSGRFFGMVVLRVLGNVHVAVVGVEIVRGRLDRVLALEKPSTGRFQCLCHNRVAVQNLRSGFR